MLLFQPESRKMSDEANVFLWELNYQYQTHAVVKSCEITATRDFYESFNQTNKETIENKEILAKLFLGMRLRVRSKIDAIKRRLEECGVYYPRDHGRIFVTRHGRH